MRPSSFIRLAGKPPATVGVIESTGKTIIGFTLTLNVPQAKLILYLE